MNQTAPIRLLVVDDHLMVRQGIISLLQSHPAVQVVGEAADGQSAIDEFRRLRPDVVLLDLRLPRGGGVDVMEAVKKEFSTARFVVLTTFDGDDDLHAAFAAGAAAYLLKDVSGDELVATITAVHAGQRLVPPDFAARTFVLESELSAREAEVLRMIVQGKSNKEIGAALFIAESTVKSHVNSLMAKLGVSSRTQAAIVAVQRGLVRIG